MTTREDFAALLVDVAFPDKAGEFNAVERSMDAFEEQARQLQEARTQMYRARQDAYWARQHAHDMTTERARIEDAFVRARRRRMSAEGLAEERKLLLQEAWAHEQSLMRELERLRTGVPLTAENADLARVVECEHCAFIVDDDGAWWCNNWMIDLELLIARGATVLAWRTT